MWLIKLPIKILLLPILLVVLTLSIFYKMILQVSSLAVGIGIVFCGLCIISTIFYETWFLAIVFFGCAVTMVLAYTCAEGINLLIDAMMGKMTGFLWS